LGACFSESPFFTQDERIEKEKVMREEIGFVLSTLGILAYFSFL
jgi:hypothetical protein